MIYISSVFLTYKLCVLCVQLSSWHGATYLQDIIQPVAEVTSRRRLQSGHRMAERIVMIIIISSLCVS